MWLTGKIQKTKKFEGEKNCQSRWRKQVHTTQHDFREGTAMRLQRRDGHTTSECFFWRSGLIVVDSSKANNPKNDDYCLNLHWLVSKKKRKLLRTALSRSLKVRPTWTWTGSGPETTTLSSFKNSLHTALDHWKKGQRERELGRYQGDNSLSLHSNFTCSGRSVKNGNYCIQL